jgi:DNA polymerase-3 subunit epsilon
MAIIDVETTGLSARYNRIIEVAVLKVRDGQLVETYATLVDPGMAIPPFIERLTGITNRELRGAPAFKAIRHDLWRLLQGSLFVAHNARFDYGFVREEFFREGMEIDVPCLCTMRLSRALFPEYSKHNLDRIMDRYGLKCAGRHRALGDATVVWDFLALVEGRFPEADLERAYAKILKR